MGKAERPTRRQRSLNLPTQIDETWQALARIEGTTMTEAFRRALVTRWRMHTQMHPELEWPHMTPEQVATMLGTEFEPKRLAYIGMRTGTVYEIAPD